MEQEQLKKKKPMQYFLELTFKERNELYYRIKRILIIILICMVIISFVAIFTLNSKLEDNIKAVNILIKCIEARR